jgi:hypothetical protein
VRRGGHIKKKEILLAFSVGLMLTAPTAAASEIISHSGMNTCNKGWYYTSGTFLNYCPECGASGTLIWNPKGTVEGEWTCSACSADYCICGKEKTYGVGKNLIKATEQPIVKPVAPPTIVNQPEPVEIVKKSINKPYLSIEV